MAEAIWGLTVLVFASSSVAFTLARFIQPHPLAPAPLFAFTWVFVLGIYHLPVAPGFLPTLRPLAYFTILGSIGAFGLGAACGRSTRPRNRQVQLFTEATSWLRLRILFVLGLAAFILNIARVLQGGGLEVYFLDNREAEFLFGRYTAINYLFFLNVAIPSMAILHARAYDASSQRSLQLILMGVLSTAFTLFHGIKATFVITLALMLIAYGVSHPHLAPRMLLLKGSILLGVLAAFFYIFTTSVRGRLSLTAAGDDGVEFLSPLYLYMAPNVANLQANLQPRDPTLGLSLLQAIVAPFTSTDLTAPPHLHHDGYNLVTYMTPLAQDLGLAGVLAGTFIIGLITSKLYGLLVLRKPNADKLLIYSVVALMLMFSFVNFHFLRPQFLMLVAVVWGSSQVLRCAERLPKHTARVEAANE